MSAMRLAVEYRLGGMGEPSGRAACSDSDVENGCWRIPCSATNKRGTLGAAKRCLVWATIASSAIFFEVGTAQSNVVSTSGDVMQIPAPPSAVRGALEDNSFAKLFAEQSSLVLESAVAVDITGTNPVDERADLTRGMVSAGTVVDSYLIHSDIVGVFTIMQYRGQVTFDRKILGVIVQASGLYATDKVLGSSSTKYLPPNEFRGFEGPGFPAISNEVRDTLQISEDFRTVTFEFRTGEMLDEARIITQGGINSNVVSEPATGGLAAVSVFALIGYRRCRRRR